MQRNYDMARNYERSNMIQRLLRYLPNTITGLRLVLIFPILSALLDENYRLAFYLVLIAGLTDGLDGLLARYYSWTSSLGAFLDPVADKLLLMSSFIIFAYLGKISTILVMAFVARDICIMMGSLIYRAWLGKIHYQPIFISKLNTFLQIGFVLLLLLHLGFIPLPLIGLNLLAVLVLVTTIVSFVQYVWFWGKKAWYQAKECVTAE